MANIPVISLFTGGGFLDIGFRQAGFDVVWTNENNSAFVRMYNSGMTSWRKSLDAVASPVEISETKSITEIPGKTVVANAFGKKRPALFGVIGGPPCPDFCAGGKNRGHNGDKGKLTRTYFERIVEIRPHFFVMENVLGLIKTHRHKAFLEEQREYLAEHNFFTNYEVLNALDSGVPQDRQRLFMIGVRKKLLDRLVGHDTAISETWFPFPQSVFAKPRPLHRVWPETTPFGDNPECPPGILKKLTVGYCFGKLPDISTLPNADDKFIAYSEKFWRIAEGDVTRKSFKRLHRHRYSPTACYGNNEVHLHPFEPRRLSVREAMRLQSIPDSYALPKEESLTDKFKLVGNAVPCLMARRLADKVREFVEPLVSQ